MKSQSPRRAGIVLSISLALLAGCSAVASMPSRGASGERRPSLGVRHSVHNGWNHDFRITDAAGTTEGDESVNATTVGVDYEFPWGAHSTAYVGLETLDLELGETWGVNLGGRYYWDVLYKSRPYLLVEVSRYGGLAVHGSPDRDPFYLLGFGLGFSYPFAEHYALEASVMHRDTLGSIETDEGAFTAKERFSGLFGLLALRWYF